MSTNAWSIKRTYVPELPPVKVEFTGWRDERINMNNLPASIEINGTVWTRTASASENGTYSYGSNGGTSSDIATRSHFTVSPSSKTSTKIYNVHYTQIGAGGSTRYYYYPDEPKAKRFVPEPMPAEIFKQLKFMVDKLLFIWSWNYASDSAYGPALPSQVKM